MKLSEDQLKSVAAWFAGGASLDEIQKRLVAECGVHVTYFDLRMIVADLPQPEEKAEPESDAQPKADAQERVPPEEGEAGGSRCRATEEQDADAQERVPPGVTVECDAIMIPGTMASGDVEFSDGVKGKWYLDQMGRLGLGGDLPPGYRPSPEDAALFQARLMETLRAKGLC
jgi:hypothetical protein